MQYYNHILAFHVISFASWMAMLFYLPRLFVYHAENIDKQEFVGIIKVQEFKLYKYIGLPSMWATIFSGVALIYLVPTHFKTGAWLHIKLTALIFLIAYSFSLGHYVKKFAKDKCLKSGKFFRIYNEVPTILMIIIVIMVVVKPV